ncbi:Snf7 family protein, putative [Ichthyophthirius multifiliis]|uniref:Snf7 family protein, putative n=1 Tax=Ichthyophthirius multifiliis TaxID=5932 RepID=G0QJK0_ICHMU|nr:Snf7 family protein, putative [Ichthyophthirius multifiliis]EGR34601.1 Snf7 family protein, putative [Ichthyophthirius multifiliis]|eukprot:XP_004039905.1 Snf7 family protein, putative [Ichthyophthirius multifiliis]
MGNDSQKPIQQPKPADPIEIQIDLKMAQKQFERESKKAEKEQIQIMEKARQAVQKGNEEGAKLYLQNAMAKQKFSQNMLKMSHKIDAISAQIKMNQGNAQYIQQLNKITPYLQHHSSNLSLEQMYGQLNNFEQAMDELTIGQKVMDNIMNKNDIQSDVAIDSMLQNMKLEYAQDINQNFQTNSKYKLYY